MYDTGCHGKHEFFIDIININLKHEKLVTEMLTLLWRFSYSWGDRNYIWG